MRVYLFFASKYDFNRCADYQPLYSSNLNANCNIPSVINHRFEKVKYLLISHDKIFVFFVVILISLSIVIGVLIVCLTSSIDIQSLKVKFFMRYINIRENIEKFIGFV